jgi:hypothetical protein
MERKNYFIVFVFFGILFAGCSDESTSSIRSVEFTSGDLTLHHDTKSSLWVDYQPSNAQQPVYRFKSDNLNVATVSPEGVVTGVHVGTCHIIVSADGCTDTCKVTVVPRSVFFSEPHIEEGYTKARVKTLEQRQLINEFRQELCYAGENPNVSKITYRFQDNLLYEVIVELVCTDCLDEVSVFLTERHHYIEVSENNSMIFQSDLVFKSNIVHVEFIMNESRLGGGWNSLGEWYVFKTDKDFAKAGIVYYFNKMFGY